MAEVLWQRDPSCRCGAELSETGDGDPVLRRVVVSSCPVPGHVASSDSDLDAAVARAVEVARLIPGLRGVDEVRLRRLIREVAPFLSTPPRPATGPSSTEEV